MDPKGLAQGHIFPKISKIEKWGSGSKPFKNHFAPFHSKIQQTGPKQVWDMTLAFPIWAMLGNVEAGSTLFENHFGFFHLKPFKMVPNKYHIGLKQDLVPGASQPP